jgi:flagellar hook-associated protein FlgK
MKVSEKILNQILEKLTSMDSEIKNINKRLNNLETKTDKNHNEVVSKLKSLESKFDDLEIKNAERHIELSGEIKDLRKDILAIETVTAKNWGDIVNLKSVKISD